MERWRGMLGIGGAGGGGLFDVWGLVLRIWGERERGREWIIGFGIFRFGFVFFQGGLRLEILVLVFFSLV